MNRILVLTSSAVAYTPSMTPPTQKTSLSLIAVSLISACTLLLEVLLTRILSIGQGYHFAFLVVSLALLGIGASGSILALTKTRIINNSRYWFIALPIFFALSLLLNYGTLNQYFIDRYELSLHILPWFQLALYIFLLALPFFFTGLLLGLIYTVRGSQIGAYYGADLLGASVGSIIFLPLAHWLAPHLLYSLIITASLVVALLFAWEGKFRKVSLIVAVATLCAILFFAIHPLIPFKSSPYKSLSLALRYPGSQALNTQWNTFSQVDLIESPAVRYAPGLSLTYEQTLPPQKGITVDGENLNGVTQWNGKGKQDIDFIASLPSSVAYLDAKPKNVLVVNAGGGLSLLEAIYWDAEQIDVVEANPLVAELTGEAFPSSPYTHDNVSLHQEDPRHFLSRTKKKYDLIVISLAENPSPASTGLYGMTENYLFTLEAFENFWSHLTDNGSLTITRYLFFPPREEPRLTRMFDELLKDKNKKVSDHLIWIQSWGTSTLLAKRSPWTEKQRSQIKEFSQRLGYDEATNYFLGMNTEDSLFDLSTPTDDRPFFFQFVQLGKIAELLEVLEGRWDILFEGGLIIWIVLGLAILFCTLFILSPLAVGSRSVAGTTKRSSLPYFLLLGLGFMFVEMALIHRSILLFTHPSYAVALSLFVILLSSGLGSVYFHKTTPGKPFPFLVLGTIVGLSVIFYLLFPSLIQWLLPLHGINRFLILFASFVPLGFAMGIPFAWGIKSLSAENQHTIPWAWAINATFSVMGAVLSVILAMQGGYSVLFLLAAGCYGGCVLFVSSFSRSTDGDSLPL